ncbi:MAG: MFS transporter, partial [Planctomycetota bacterium]
IGILPGYEVLGASAAVLLVLLRMIQGLSVGGEYTTSIVFLVEESGRKHHGFAASWSGFGAVGGILLGSAVGAVVTATLPDESVRTWGWRLPFVIGLFVGLVGLFIRRHIPERARNARSATGPSPIREAFRNHWRLILRIALFNSVGGIGFYFAFVFLVTYMQDVGGLGEAEALEINTLNMAVVLAITPFAGWLSDRIGRMPIVIAGMGGMLLFSWPLLQALQHHSPAWNFCGQFGFAILIGLIGGVVPVMMVEMTPANVRCSSISIGYNLCLALVGGTTPLAMTSLIEETGDAGSPAWYLMSAAVVSLTVAVATLLVQRKPET